jgi:ribosomal protein L29
MGDQDRVKDLEALQALLADIETELASESEDNKSKIRELRQHCMLKLALLNNAKKKEPKSS